MQLVAVVVLSHLGEVWCLASGDRGHEPWGAADHDQAVGSGGREVGLELHGHKGVKLSVNCVRD